MVNSTACSGPASRARKHLHRVKIRSIPAARSRFIWNSGLVISHPSMPAGTASMCTSRPGAPTSTGVSTSTKSRAAKNERSAAAARARFSRLRSRPRDIRAVSVSGVG